MIDKMKTIEDKSNEISVNIDFGSQSWNLNKWKRSKIFCFESCKYIPFFFFQLHCMEVQPKSRLVMAKTIGIITSSKSKWQIIITIYIWFKNFQHSLTGNILDCSVIKRSTQIFHLKKIAILQKIPFRCCLSKQSILSKIEIPWFNETYKISKLYVAALCKIEHCNFLAWTYLKLKIKSGKLKWANGHLA